MHKGPIAFCLACGAYFWRRVGCLARPCRHGSIGAQSARLAKGLFPAHGAHYQDLVVTDVRKPSQVELAEIARQVQSASMQQREPGSGAALPRRRLQAKTGPAARRSLLAREIRSAFGVDDQDEWRNLVQAWKRRRLREM
eukprot:3777125-Karenia_brevis.AAC.1